jgi:catechol 2,3-dioxygenase-like lactoylglutathione lyase family enzyme
MNLQFAHLSLGVSDLDESERFYRDVLGLPTARRGDKVEVRWSNVTLTLAHRPPATRAKFQIGFSVENAADVDAWAARLRAGGVNIMSGPSNADGERRVYFVDPDNYEIEIVATARVTP